MIDNALKICYNAPVEVYSSPFMKKVVERFFEKGALVAAWDFNLPENTPLRIETEEEVDFIRFLICGTRFVSDKGFDKDAPY